MDSSPAPPAVEGFSSGEWPVVRAELFRHDRWCLSLRSAMTGRLVGERLTHDLASAKRQWRPAPEPTLPRSAAPETSRLQRHLCEDDSMPIDQVQFKNGCSSDNHFMIW